MQKKVLVLVAFFTLSFFMFNCGGGNSATKSEKKVEWTESDYAVIADSLVQNILRSDLVTKFKYRRKPKFVVGKVADTSGLSTDEDLLSKNIERALLNSGKVSFISSKEKRENSRYNRKERSDFRTEKEFKKYLKQLRTDFFVTGNFEIQTDSLLELTKRKYILSVEVIKPSNMKVISTERVIILK